MSRRKKKEESPFELLVRTRELMVCLQKVFDERNCVDMYKDVQEASEHLSSVVVSLSVPALEDSLHLIIERECYFQWSALPDPVKWGFVRSSGYYGSYDFTDGVESLTQRFTSLVSFDYIVNNGTHIEYLVSHDDYPEYE